MQALRWKDFRLRLAAVGKPVRNSPSHDDDDADADADVAAGLPVGPNERSRRWTPAVERPRRSLGSKTFPRSCSCFRGATRL
jgi:hypothetical protein